MVKMLFEAHSGVRYLVLLVAIIAIAYLAFALVQRRPWDRPANALSAAFTGLLDLQAVLGVVLILAGFQYYGALTGHIAMMVVAVIVAHVLRVMSKRAASDSKRQQLALAAVVIPLLLMIGGIFAIERSIF